MNKETNGDLTVLHNTSNIRVGNAEQREHAKFTMALPY